MKSAIGMKFFIGLLCLLVLSVTAFVGEYPSKFLSFDLVTQTSHGVASTRTASTLYAKKKASGKKKSGGGGGFGGAAMEPCPCGSGETFSRCCGKIHKDINAFKAASASEIVRARYSAYAKKQADFLIATTHPLHKDFTTDLRAWKDQIKLNMYDNFDMTNCVIVEENYEEGDEVAFVTFVAELVLRSTGEVTGFQETARLERAKTHGGWLYLNGTMAAAPEDTLTENLSTEES